jgi:hypothetical protein
VNLLFTQLMASDVIGAKSSAYTLTARGTPPEIIPFSRLSPQVEDPRRVALCKRRGLPAVKGAFHPIINEKSAPRFRSGAHLLNKGGGTYIQVWFMFSI